MESLERKCLLWIIRNLEQFPVALLSQTVPTRIKLKLLLALPVVDICKLEKTPFVRDVDMEIIWRRCLEFSGESRIHSRLQHEWSAKQVYFNKLCSIAVNVDLQLKGHRSMEAQNLCKSFLFLPVDRMQPHWVHDVIHASSRYDAIEFTNVSLMQHLTIHCGYYPRLLVFTNALKLLPQEFGLEIFLSQVEHVIFNPNPFKYDVFPAFCAYVIEELCNNSSSHLHYIEFFNCETVTWKCILPVLSIKCSAADKVLVLKGIAIVSDEEIDHEDVESVADIVASVILAQKQLEEFFISNWFFPRSGKNTAKLLSAIKLLLNQPCLKSLGIENCALTREYFHSIIHSFLLSNAFATQRLYICNVRILGEQPMQTSFYAPTHDFSRKTLHLQSIDLHFLLPVLVQYDKLNFQSLALIFPREQSESVISDILTHSSIASTVINLSGVNFTLLANPSACIKSVLLCTDLLELYLDSCFLSEGNLLNLLALIIPQAHSLRVLSVRENHIGLASNLDIRLFFAGICKLSQLHLFELDLSSNLITFLHLKIFRDTLVDTGRDCCLKRLSVYEVVADIEMNDEILHVALSDLLEELSIQHKYSVVSNNWHCVDHIANM